jgi:hypothetical protein
MKFTKIVRRRRDPQETPTARAAIRNHCLECCGYIASEVTLCTAPQCWLYPWRQGKTPAEIKRNTPTGAQFGRQNVDLNQGGR